MYRRRNYGRKRHPYRKLKPYAFSKNRLQMKNRYYTKTAGGVTEQRDVSNAYQKRRMPRWKKKAWVSFAKKAQYVALKQLGQKTMLFQDRVGRTWADTPDYQDTCGLVLAGKDGTRLLNSHEGNDDLRRIFNEDPNLSGNNTKMYIMNAEIQINFHNTGANTLIVDMYEIMYTGNTMSGSDFKSIINAAALNTPRIDGTTPTTATNISMRGITPFDVIKCIQTGFKVIKKKTYYVKPLEGFRYRQVIRKQQKIDFDDLGPVGTQCFHKYYTRYFFFVVQNLPRIDAQNSGAYTVEGIRNYRYVTPEDNEYELQWKL